MKKHHTAFTLAEVLITLAIIGIVAALTIPSLITKYKKTVTVNKLKKFYSVMSNATNLAIAEYGPMENWDGFSSARNPEEVKNWFHKYLKPYVKIIDESIEMDEISEIPTYRATFADGSIMRLTNWAANTPDIDEETGEDNNHVVDNFNGLIHVYYYTDRKGLKKEYHKPCVNEFSFLFYNKFNKRYSFQPYTWQVTKPEDYNREYILNNIKRDLESESSSGSQMCSALIMLDGWEIKDDYPVKF